MHSNLPTKVAPVFVKIKSVYSMPRSNKKDPKHSVKHFYLWRQRECLTSFNVGIAIHQSKALFKGTGTRDLIWLKVVSLERS